MHYRLLCRRVSTKLWRGFPERSAALGSSGVSWDNARADNLFVTLKTELTPMAHPPSGQDGHFEYMRPSTTGPGCTPGSAISVQSPSKGKRSLAQSTLAA